jgi:hypothetical protein
LNCAPAILTNRQQSMLFVKFNASLNITQTLMFLSV